MSKRFQKRLQNTSLVFLLAVLFCGGITNVARLDAREINMVKLEPGVYDLPLKLPKELEPRREELRGDCIAAQRNIRRFAERSGWASLTYAPLVEEVEIFATKSDFDEQMCSLSPELRGKPISKRFSAAVEKNIFFAVTPEVFESNSPNDREPQSYVKLLTHELAHRLEARIVDGDEDKMGPIWFFEGFAVYAADQYSANLPKLTDAEIWAIVDAKERGSYPKYKAVFIHFLKGTTLQEYVKQASAENFTQWLHERSAQ